jgi:hypothetical protein
MLTAHVATSLGWFGAAAAVLALGIAGLATADAGVASGAYFGTEVIWRFVIIPFSLGAVLTGLVQAFGTQWGLLRHYWVVAKFVITISAVLLLLLHTGSLLPALARAAAADVSGATESAGAHHHAGVPPRIHLIVAASGTLLLLLTAAALSIYKPWGKTAIGARRAEGA